MLIPAPEDNGAKTETDKQTDNRPLKLPPYTHIELICWEQQKVA